MTDTAVSAGALKCVLVTPEGQLLDSEADMVVINAQDGQFGILPKRAPLLCKLAPGILRMRKGKETRYFFVGGGFADVMDNQVTVITPEAFAAEELDMEAVERDLTAASHLPQQTPEEREFRNRKLKIARAKQLCCIDVKSEKQ